VKQTFENASLNEPITLDTTPADSIQSLANATQQFLQVMRDESLSDQEVMDSLKNMEIINVDTTAFNKMIFRQGRKVLKNDLNVFGAYIVQNLPIMMFLLLPLFALLLKLFYIRRGILYVQHLAHALHLHAFIFILFGVLIIGYLIFQLPPSLSTWLNWITFLLFVIYPFFSFLHVYRQGWIKTAVKVFLLGSIYFVVLLFFGLSEAFVSFLIF
jgi:membrane-associated HD superfamily phosphohydrolase